MFKFIKRMAGKVGSFSTVRQARAARRLEAPQIRRQAAGKKVIKTPYVWGTLGLSEVSAAILKDRGSIVDRSTRRKVAKRLGKPFVGYTTGTSYHQLPHQVGRQLQKSNAYFAKINSKKWRKAAGER